MIDACRICRNSDRNRIHRAREMMFGTRDQFDYLECAVCGTIQIREIPDLSCYYPKDYYSLDEAGETYIGKHLRRRLAARLAGAYFLKNRSLIGRYLAGKKDWLDFYFPDSLKEPLLGLDFRAKILDSAAGAGGFCETFITSVFAI
jgi:hypothetical protein